MSLHIQGKLHSATQTQQKTDTFSVRTFVLRIEDNGYTNYAQFQLTNQACSLLDNFQRDQFVTVHFDVRGNMWQAPDGQEKCITNLNAWRIEAVQQPAPAPAPQQQWGQPAQQQPQQPQQWGQPAPQPQQQQPQPQNGGAPF